MPMGRKVKALVMCIVVASKVIWLESQGRTKAAVLQLTFGFGSGDSIGPPEIMVEIFIVQCTNRNAFMLKSIYMLDSPADKEESLATPMGHFQSVEYSRSMLY